MRVVSHNDQRHAVSQVFGPVPLPLGHSPESRHPDFPVKITEMRSASIGDKSGEYVRGFDLHLH